MNAAPDKAAKPSRFYAPDYRRRLRDAGALRSLSPSAQITLAALCDRANAAGVAWPTVETMARDYGLGESTVRRALGELTAAGLVIVLRRAGRVSRYHLTIPSSMTAAASEHGPAQNEPLPLSNWAPIMANDQSNDQENQQQAHDLHADAPEETRTAMRTHEASPVVVSTATPTEKMCEISHTESPAPAARSSENETSQGDAIVLLAEDLRERLRALGIAPAKVNRYGGDRVRWVLDALAAANARRPIGNPAGWVMQALSENWAMPPAVVQRAIPFGMAAAESNKPPVGTAWARDRKTGAVLEVLDVNEIRVQLAGGVAAPSCRWCDWEWLTENPDAQERAVDGEHETSAEASADAAERGDDRRRDLARVSAWWCIKQRSAAELTAKIEACGLTLDDWDAYQAIQALEAQLNGMEDRPNGPKNRR